MELLTHAYEEEEGGEEGLEARGEVQGVDGQDDGCGKGSRLEHLDMQRGTAQRC